MKNILILTVGLLLIVSCNQSEQPILPESEHNMKFDKLSSVWDEAVPLGNGEIGALIWQNEDLLRFSLDRSDLWDLRPIVWLEKEEFRFDWVYQKWKEDDYGIVQDFFDRGAYSNSIAPSKIPGAALEFKLPDLGEVEKVELDISTAIASVIWENGTELEVYVDANSPKGHFRFSNIHEDVHLRLTPPKYESDTDSGLVDEVTGQDLRRLGYKQGDVKVADHHFSYHQKGWRDFYYDVAVQWAQSDNTLEGSWSVTSVFSDEEGQPNADELTSDFDFEPALPAHKTWWAEYWKQSGLSIPDPVLEKQYFLEMYKFGAAAREDTPPISLQAVWTADNGKMPPWKGDFHHDLNTQLSYWPAYKGNQLGLESGFLNWLWDIRPIAKEYTKTYFGVDGLNVPGVTTLEGKPMGGWIQYSCGPTVSAWLGQHFYLHWRYSMDREFLETRAYPWIREVAVFLDEFSVRRDDGMRKLPLSSSPEIHNNSREAWFSETTNFDLALIRFTYQKAAELALELGLDAEAAKWKSTLDEWPELLFDSTGLKFAEDEPYTESHRHFSHLLGWHPLGILDVSQGEAAKSIIKNTLNTLEEYGPDWWTGYSYAWLGNLYARNFQGDKAARALRDFADCFVLPNTFHVNGDQCKAGKSKFTYRPFTLEGNFAFASGIQEMLIQSHSGVIRIFPAIPENWRDVAFYKLRAEGGFLVSARIVEGQLTKIKVEATAACRATIYFGDGDEPLIDKTLKAGEIIEE